MADYETSVNILIDSDLEKTKQNLEELIRRFENLERTVQAVMRKFSASNSLANAINRINNLDLSKFENQAQSITAGIQSLNDILGNIRTEHLQNMANMLEGIRRVIDNFDGSGLKSLTELPETMKKMEKVDSTALGKVFSTLAQDIQPFLAHLKEAASELRDFSNIAVNLANFNSQVNTTKKSVEELGNKSDKTKSKLKKMFSIGNLMYLGNMVKFMSQKVFAVLEKPIDFAETENKFAVALGEMKNKALKFQNEITEIFGLDIAGTMEAQATFENMLSSLSGLSEEKAEELSETMTKMSIDFASLYNVSLDSAYTKMQSALSRQVRPIRSVSGYDITQNVLGDSLKQMGIYDRTVTKLSEMEKRLLIIYTLQKQMVNSNAMGDFANTIEQPANQLKVLQEQIKQVGRWLGAVFMGTIGRILPYINAFTMVIKEIIKTFALLVGYEMPNTPNRGTILDQMSDSTDTLNTGLDNAKKKIDALTAPFDKLNIISEPSSSSSSNSGGGVGGIDPRILNAINDYNMGLESVQMQATAIRDRIMEWLGFTKLVNKETGEVYFKLKDGITNLGLIGTALAAIPLIAGGIKLANWLKPILDVSTPSANLSVLQKKVGELILRFDSTKISLSNLKGVLTKVFTPKTLGIALIIATVGALIELYNSTEDFRNLVDSTLSKLGGLLNTFYNSVLVPIFDFLVVCWKDILEPLLKLIGEQFVEAVEGISSYLLKLSRDVLIPVADVLLNVLGFALETIVGIVELAAPYIVELFTLVLEFFKGAFTGDFTAFTVHFGKIWQSAVDGVKNAWSPVSQFFSKCWTDIKNAFGNVSKWFGDTFSKAWQKVKDVFSTGGKIFDGIKDGILSGLKKTVNGIIKGINKVIKVPFDGLNSALKKVKKIDIFGLKPFNFIKTISVPQIPQLYKGGFVPENAGQLFIANEPGNPELVGNIGGRTSVVNNNMILEGIEGAMTNAIIKGFQQVRTERADGTIIIENYYDGQLIERKIIEANDRHIRKTGKPLFSY